MSLTKTSRMLFSDVAQESSWFSLTLVLPYEVTMTRRFTTTHHSAATILPNTKTNKKHFILTFALWGVWDSPTVKRKCFTLFLNEVKLSQHVAQWLKGHNDPKRTQGLIQSSQQEHLDDVTSWSIPLGGTSCDCRSRGSRVSNPLPYAALDEGVSQRSVSNSDSLDHRDDINKTVMEASSAWSPCAYCVINSNQNNVVGVCDLAM